MSRRVRPVTLGLVALAAGCTSTPTAAPVPTALLPNSVVQYVLETTPSGELVNWRTEGSEVRGTVTPLRTFRAGLGFCRDYAVTLVHPEGEGAAWQDTACRNGEGVWLPPPVGS